MSSETYARELEDHSGFIVARTSSARGWEEVLGLGNTPESAWNDYLEHKEGRR